MKLLKFFVFVFILSYTFVYAEDNETALKNIDNESVSDNETAKKSKQIKPKLVPDRKINDKNQFMTNFGFPAREELKFNVNLNAKDEGLYDDVTLSMVNRWSKNNMWGKDRLYIEGAVSGGIIGFNSSSVNTVNVQSLMPIIPYGSLSLKFMSGSRFSPELKIQDSRFIFKNSDINIGETTQNYNYYYLKMPLGFSIPFFGYKSKMSVDGSYSSMQGNFKVLRPFLLKGNALSAGDIFSASYTSWNVRLYLETPVVLKPSISEYAYFGVYYDETSSPHSAAPGSDYPGYSTMLINALARSGGVFYDMQLNLYKGLMFGIGVNIGYGDIEVKKDTASYSNVEYDSIKGLIAYKAKLNLGYEYIFKKQHVGVGVMAGVEYAGYTPFFFAKQENLYDVRLDGELKYFVELKFLFGY